MSPTNASKLKIALSGASGLIGTALRRFLSEGGHYVELLVRRSAGASEIRWDPAAGTIDANALEGVDAVVHLSGASLAEGRWTEAKKKEFFDSRVGSTRLLGRTLAVLKRKPAVLVSASAIGFYGNRGDEALTEASAKGSGFLPDLCEQWEAAAGEARDAGIRVVHPRIGLVLSSHGGALAKMLTPFKLGMGGVIGSGRQYMSWIAIADLLRVIEACLHDPALSGAVNATAPNPVTNHDFVKTLGHVLGRPTLMHVPAFTIDLMLGEMGRTLLLEGAKVIPTKLIERKFVFACPTLESALRAALEHGDNAP
jgi:uncharacterized protein (TIGR01777 family)